MKEVLFSAGSVLFMILIASAIVFNPLTLKIKEKLCYSRVPISTIQSQPLRPIATNISFFGNETCEPHEQPVIYYEHQALA